MPSPPLRRKGDHTPYFGRYPKVVWHFGGPETISSDFLLALDTESLVKLMAQTPVAEGRTEGGLGHDLEWMDRARAPALVNRGSWSWVEMAAAQVGRCCFGGPHLPMIPSHHSGTIAGSVSGLLHGVTGVDDLLADGDLVVSLDGAGSGCVQPGVLYLGL